MNRYRVIARRKWLRVESSESCDGIDFAVNGDGMTEKQIDGSGVGEGRVFNQ